MRHRPIALLTLAAIAGFAPAASAAPPTVHAHRGGALSFGDPVLPENTLPVFRNTADRFPGTWLELDSVVSSDGVPFVIHDSTLDRTTDCAGPVVQHTAAEIEACRVDVLGVSSTLAPAPAVPVVRVPRLAEVLAFAREHEHLGVNIEIKRIPGDPGYVPGDEAFATSVLDVVRAAGIPRERLIVQSFDPTNLDTARRVLPHAQLSFLTLAQVDAAGPAFAAARGYDWISPGSVPSPAFVSQAHSLGLKVVPYTLNTSEQVQAAAAAGVDALITDDPGMARQALGVPDVATPAAPAARSPRQRTVRITTPRRSRRQVYRRGGVAVGVRAGGPTEVAFRITRGRVRVASGIVRLRGSGTRRALVRLTPAGRRLVRRARRPLRLVVRAVVDGRPRPARALVLR